MSAFQVVELSVSVFHSLPQLVQGSSSTLPVAYCPADSTDWKK